MALKTDREVIECEYRGPLAISRDMLMGQTCWHPVNLKEGRLHLFSKCCEEWGEDCPIHRKGSQR